MCEMSKPAHLGLSILEISQTLMHEFWYITSNGSIKTTQNYAIWIQKALIHIKTKYIY